MSSRSSWRGRLPWIAMVLILAVAFAIGARGRSGPVTDAQRVRHIASEIRCPTCRNQSAAESDAAAAKAVRDAGDLDEADYRTLKDDYTARAAAVLHAIDERRACLTTAQRGARHRRSTKWMALVVAAVIGLAIGGGVLVAGTSGERVPGQT